MPNTKIAAVVLAVACLGCSADPGEAGAVEGPLAVDEYAAAVCAIDDGTDMSSTWGEFAAEQGAYTDLMRAMAPPEDLAEWHEAMMWTSSLMVEYAAEQPPDDVFNPFSLLGIAMVAAPTISDAEADVPAETVAVLTAHGCDTDTWGERLS